MYCSNAGARKGQSNLDFLMTYGWAIAIVAVAVALIFLLGVFDPSSFLGTKSSGFSGVAVKGWAFTGSTGVLTLKLTNQLGQRINITGVSASIGAETRAFDISSLPGTIANGETTGVINSAAFSTRGAGSGYQAKLTINYTNLETNFAATTKGTLTGKAISGSALACAMPVASPPAGSYSSAQAISLSSENGSTTYYTTDGNAPTTGSAVYSGAIDVPLDSSMTIKAFSAKTGYSDSPVFSGTYIVTHTIAMPSVSPPPGQYNSSQNVTLSAENGSTTRYTTDNSTPTLASAVYTGAINVPLGANTTIKAFSSKSGYADSPVFSGTYIVAPAPSPQPNSSVVLQMDFDNDVGAIAVDSSIYGNNGAIVNATHTGGRFGQALNFTGTGYVSIPNNASLNLRQNITLEAWVMWNVDPYAYYLSNPSTRGWAQIIDKNGDNEWQLQHSQLNTKFEFALRVFNGTNTVRKYIQGTTAPQLGTWYHVAGTYDGQYMKLYVNGQVENQVDMVGNISTSASEVNIGRRVGGGYIDRYFNGLIDGVKVHNRSLSAGELN